MKVVVVVVVVVLVVVVVEVVDKRKVTTSTFTHVARVCWTMIIQKIRLIKIF